MTIDLEKVKAVFHRAVDEHPPDQWDSYLDAACAGDAELRQEVMALLRAHNEGGSLLDAPQFAANGDKTAASLTERPGTVIGLYKLLQQIGEGGMGVVFMAEQSEPIQRTVALKIIKPGMDTRQVIARFEAERQAVAMMDHPNIAKVLDAGTTDSDRPYFVMELVKGVPITKYCDEKHLPLRARLELFTQVCQAVQHAHQKGIIHRDIKPNNVLVAEYDDKPIPKVIDFGVAKATAQKLTERTMFTEFGQVLGTMEYMSPEQSKFNQLDIDTRSDIYSLGVLLYELLTGSTPFEGKRLHEAAFDEMLRIIREEEPPKPSTRVSSIDTLPSVAVNRHTEPARLSKDMRGELDWIVMKALEKDRNRRYETASGFAADVERHLHDEPVDARPAKQMYRMKKFIRRNKFGVLAGSAVTASLIIGLALASIGLVQARRQAEIARTEATQAARMTQRATQVQQFLQEMLISINPDAQVGATVTVQQMLDRVGEKIDSSFANQPDVRAVLHQTIGETYYGLQLYALATTHLRMAVDLRRRYLPEERLELADALLDLAKSETAGSGDLVNALSSCREAKAIFASELPKDDWRIGLAKSLEAYLVGEAAGNSSAHIWSAAALPLLSLLSDEQLARLPPDWARAIAEAKRLRHAGNAAGAAAVLRRWHLAASERAQKLAATGDREAIRQFVHEYSAPFMDVPLFRQIMPLAGVNRARQLKSAGENPLLIEAVLREAIDAGHKVWGAEHPNIAWALHEFATLLRDEGRLTEAEVVAREAFEMRQKVLGPENPETAKSLDVLSHILQKQNKTAEAVNLRREAEGVTPRAPSSADNEPTTTEP